MPPPDHSDPWPAPTSAANTGPIHRRAQNLKTDGLISMRQPSPGTFEWTTRTGHTYTRHPEPVPIAGWHDHLPQPVDQQALDPRGDPPETIGTPDPLADEWMLHAC